MLAHGSHMGIQPAHTWDGEPKSLHASMASLAQSHHQHHGPPMPHHHRMVLGENGAPSKLPMRQRPPGHKASPPPAKKKSGLGCCSGHFVVIWIILGIVTFGVLLSSLSTQDAFPSLACHSSVSCFNLSVKR